MPSYLSPGVYMEEVDKGSKPIEGVGTAVAAFVGYTEKASDTRNGKTVSLVGKPTLVTNWSQYVAKFGGFSTEAYTPDAVYGYFANGGTVCYVLSVKTLSASADGANATTAIAAVPSLADKNRNLLDFKAKEAGSSGNKIEVEVKVPAGEPDAEGKPTAGKTFTLNIKVDGVTAETYGDLSLGKGDNNVQTVVATKSKLITVDVVSTNKADIVPIEGTYALAGGKVETKAVTIADYTGDATTRTGLAGLEALDDVTMVLTPDLMMAYSKGEIDMKGVQAVQQTIIDYCELVRYCFAILDCPPNMMPQEMKEWRNTVNYDTTRAAVYYPWIEIPNMTGEGGPSRVVPPSGHMAGVYARTDGTRGVHKAPANELVRNCIGLELLITKGEQDLLNPIGVNCIRTFPGAGVRVWGARTLSSNPSWRYINVRRLFNMIEESIERGTQWVVFEPNDPFLWGRVTRDVSAFLRGVWRQGALFGQTAEAAFYVKCDAETNPTEARDLGQLVVEIGIAPVKPAEFVIFRVSQWSGADA